MKVKQIPKLKKMSTIKKAIGLWGFLTLFCMGNVVAQRQFTEKVSMNNVGNKNDTYYLLLCKLQSNVSSKMTGTITIETATSDTTGHLYNHCGIEVIVSSIDNKMVINNMCNDMNASMVTVQYGGNEYFAVELAGMMNVADISFTGIAENKSLLLVNGNAVTVNNNSRSSALTSTGDPWETLDNNIFNTNDGNVGIGTMFPTTKLNVVGISYFNGNVGIGTATPDNSNGWHKVLDIFGTNHAKLLVRSTNVKTGIFSHESWNNSTVGRIGTESQHDLRLMAGYGKDVMTLKTNGNVGIGTTDPQTNLHVAGNVYLHSSSIGRSGTQYDEFGYNIGFTGTNNTYTYRITNPAASVRMGWNGSIEFRTAPSGTAGSNLILTERMKILVNGNVGIGTTTPAHLLTVAGTIGAREVKVETNMGADFVFAPAYPLLPLSELEQFITTNKHLPDIAPADTMIQNGVNMGEFQIQLLQKIEELTLYVIEQEKRMKEQDTRIETQQREIEELKKTNR